MNDPDQTQTWTMRIGDDLQERSGSLDHFSMPEEQPTADPTAGFINLAFITGALRRWATLWCAFAVVGLLIGAGIYLHFPAAHKASASVVLADNPSDLSGDEIATDAALAQSRTVAALVVRQLGLRQSIGSFQASYTVTVITDQVLTFTVGAPSSGQALLRASSLATSFLEFRANYLEEQQQLEATELAQQVSQAQQRLTSIDRNISLVLARPTSSAQQAELHSLQTERDQASTALTQVEQYATATLASAQTITNSMVQGSEVLDAAAPIPSSHLRSIALHFGGGLFGGLVLGVGIVIICAAVSDRLRRREDIAYALGAPVMLSVGTLRVRRWLPNLPGRARTRNIHLRRVVAHLGTTASGSSRDPAGLAVVAVDDARVVARAVISLAVSSAKQGKQVMVADLSAGARAARLMGIRKPGVHTARKMGVNLMVAVPDRDDVAPVGPIRANASVGISAPVSEALIAACASADLLLVLATLDPAFGGDHLITWATDGVAVVTAGRSSAEKVHSVGEMIRLAGVRLRSVVLIGADKTDESLGVSHVWDDSVPYSPIDSRASERPWP